jgi:transcriptional regulator with XRE-family HTH domain
METMTDSDFPGLSGARLRALMRKQGVTIRELAKRMRNTMKQIRERRNNGIPTFSLRIDYEQAIYGELTPRLRAAWRQFYRQTQEAGA